MAWLCPSCVRATAPVPGAVMLAAELAPCAMHRDAAITRIFGRFVPQRLKAAAESTGPAPPAKMTVGGEWWLAARVVHAPLIAAARLHGGGMTLTPPSPLQAKEKLELLLQQQVVAERATAAAVAAQAAASSRAAAGPDMRMYEMYQQMVASRDKLTQRLSETNKVLAMAADAGCSHAHGRKQAEELRIRLPAPALVA